MTQEIAIQNIGTINSDLLDAQLKTAAVGDYYGFKMGFGGAFTLILSDVANTSLIDQLRAIVLAHDPNGETPTQTAQRVGKVSLENWLSLVDKAITDIATKRAALVSSQNLATAAALLLEITDDTTLALKAMKYIATRIEK